MKKIIIILSIVILTSSVIAGLIFIKKNQIEEMRTKLTSVSASAEYYGILNVKIDSLIKKGSINKAHKTWMKELIEKNLQENNYEESFIFLINKLRSKNIQFTINQQKEMKEEYLSIKDSSIIRIQDVDNTIKEYKKMRSSDLYSLIESQLIGKPLQLEDIRYF